MVENFSEQEVAVIVKYLRLSKGERRKLIDGLVSSEFEEMYSKGYRSSIIFDKLTQKYNKSEVWVRNKVSIKSLSK